MSEHKAGRELDALVAERVMGLAEGKDFGVWPEHDWRESDSDATPFVCARCSDISGWVSREELKRFHPGPCKLAPPDYSTSILFAWAVVERMREQRWDATVEGYSGGWIAQFSSPRDLATERADTPALAICHAALAAVRGATEGGQK